MLAITSATAITTATISWPITSAKALRSAYKYGNNTNHTKILGKTFSHTPLLVFKIAGTFSSDLRKPCWITGKSLSPKS